MRYTFAKELLSHALQDKRIFLITADLGFGMWDEFRDKLPDRFLNAGASEQSACGICVGLALKGYIPFFYSITTFLLYRPFETIKLYVDYEKIPIKLCGSGRDDDYKHDGVSHNATGLERLFDSGIFKNIKTYWPETKEEIPSLVEMMVYNKLPSFISLKRE